MRSIFNFIFLGVTFCFVSCKSFKHSLYSTTEEVNFSKDDLENSEKIEFTYIPSFYYSTFSEINSRDGAEYRRQTLKKGFDSIVNLEYKNLNIKNTISIPEKSNLKDLIQNELLITIKEIDTLNGIHNIKLPQTLKKIVNKSTKNHSILVLNNINFTTLGQLTPNIIDFQKDHIRTEHMTFYIFILNNQNKSLVYFHKSSKIDGYLSKKNQYELFEEIILNFLRKTN